MAGQRIGCARVGTLDQNEQRQLDGQALDRIFCDKASGRDTLRSQLAELLRFTRDGDTVVVHGMDRLARNLDDLQSLVQVLTRKGVRVEFVKEHVVFTGVDSPMANLMLSVMGAFPEFERALMKERQRESITLAQQRGAYRVRKKTPLQSEPRTFFWAAKNRTRTNITIAMKSTDVILTPAGPCLSLGEETRRQYPNRLPH